MKLLRCIACFIITLAGASCVSPHVAINSLRVDKSASAPPVNRSNAYYKYTLGMLAERHGNYGKAIKYYNQATRGDKTLARAYQHSATLSLRLGNIKSAEKVASIPSVYL